MGIIGKIKQNRSKHFSNDHKNLSESFTRFNKTDHISTTTLYALNTGKHKFIRKAMNRTRDSHSKGCEFRTENEK